MTRFEKLLDRARKNPGRLSFHEFEWLMAGAGWRFDRQRGSHRIWYSPKKALLSVQSRGGQAKSYQVKQFLKVFDVEAR